MCYIKDKKEFYMPKRICPPNKVITDLYDSGMSPAEIGNHLGISKNTICSRLRNCGHKLRSISDAKKLSFERGTSKKSYYWTGKKQSKESIAKRVAKMTGKNNPRYIDGKHVGRGAYRRVIKKEKCSKCDVKKNLGIHHKDLDHYNNDPENLQVLCVSCHMSLHKQMYWESIKAGETPLKSNGIVGWVKDDK
jgi:predicted DNA-binding protein YlxM (UPF0122 family)